MIVAGLSDNALGFWALFVHCLRSSLFFPRVHGTPVPRPWSSFWNVNVCRGAMYAQRRSVRRLSLSLTLCPSRVSLSVCKCISVRLSVLPPLSVCSPTAFSQPLGTETLSLSDLAHQPISLTFIQSGRVYWTPAGKRLPIDKNKAS